MAKDPDPFRMNSDLLHNMSAFDQNPPLKDSDQKTL
jgi:hypothetical protein